MFLWALCLRLGSHLTRVEASAREQGHVIYRAPVWKEAGGCVGASWAWAWGVCSRGCAPQRAGTVWRLWDAPVMMPWLPAKALYRFDEMARPKNL